MILAAVVFYVIASLAPLIVVALYLPRILIEYLAVRIWTVFCE